MSSHGNNSTLNNASYSSGDDISEDEDPKKKQLRKMFSRLAGEDNEIDAEELQDILTTSLKKGVNVTIMELIIILIICR